MTLIAAPPPAPRTESVEREPEPYRLTVDQYHAMIDAGLFHPEDRLELIDGQLVTKMTKNERHLAALKLGNQVLGRALPEGWHIGQEHPVVIVPHHEPEPDLVVIRGGIRDYLVRKPGPADVALLVEISDTSYGYDHSRKLAIYAAAGFVIYWILNLVERRLEVYSDPTGPSATPGYRRRQDYGPDEVVPFVLDGREVGRLAVADLLP